MARHGYIHCPACVKEADNIEGESPRTYARYEVCFSDNTIIISCIRHEKVFWDFDINAFLNFIKQKEQQEVQEEVTTH
jgi:hypothetical protein